MQANAACPECGPESKIAESEDCLVCTACGHVIDEGQLKPADFVLAAQKAPAKCSRRNRSTLKGAARLVSTTRKGEAYIAGLCIALGLGFLAKPSLFILDCYADKVSGPKTNMLMAACVYVALRQAAKPCSLSQLASLVPCSRSALAKSYLGLRAKLGLSVADVEPTAYLKSYYEQLVYSRLLPGLVYSANTLERASAFLRLAQSAWLDCGRLAGPLCLAALLLGLASLSANRAVLSSAFIRSICDFVGLSYQSTALRLSELKQLIHDRLSSLSLFSAVPRSRVLDYLDDYLQYEPLVASTLDAAPAMPPSLQRTLQRQADLKDRIEDAKLWIASQSSKGVGALQSAKRRHDLLDLSIRQLLLIKVPEETIVQLHPGSMAQFLSELTDAQDTDAEA